MGKVFPKVKKKKRSNGWNGPLYRGKRGGRIPDSTVRAIASLKGERKDEQHEEKRDEMSPSILLEYGNRKWRKKGEAKVP